MDRLAAFALYKNTYLANILKRQVSGDQIEVGNRGSEFPYPPKLDSQLLVDVSHISSSSNSQYFYRICSKG